MAKKNEKDARLWTVQFRALPDVTWHDTTERVENEGHAERIADHYRKMGFPARVKRLPPAPSKPKGGARAGK